MYWLTGGQLFIDFPSDICSPSNVLDLLASPVWALITFITLILDVGQKRASKILLDAQTAVQQVWFHNSVITEILHSGEQNFRD